MDIISQLANEFKLKLPNVQNAVKLMDDGCTVPFIARYRKEMTGEMNDQVLRELSERLIYLRNLQQRREEVYKSIEEQGRMTAEIKAALTKAVTLQAIEDIYSPYKPKRRTRAVIAREKGLEPLAAMLLLQNLKTGSVEELAEPYVNAQKEVLTVRDALDGAMDIIAEDISETPEYRQMVRTFLASDGMVVSKKKKDDDSVYTMYYDFHEPVAKIPGYRVLAINRGEKEGFLQVKVEAPKEAILGRLCSAILKSPTSLTTSYVKTAFEDSLNRLMFPSAEREIRNNLTEAAEDKAIKVFAANLKNLLLQPPVKGKTVLGLDPAYRTGCKLAVVDSTGKLLDTTVIYPTPPQNKVEEAKKKVQVLIEKYKIEIVAIGNGTASKESEIFVAQLIKELDQKIYYMVVSEAGASVYSASKIGAEEFPDYDVSLRSAVSIARRLQDPLAELVKIDPKAIGVGQYQHDMNQKHLGESLGGVVEDCVNNVGVDLNTASPSLLSYISGINTSIAKNIVAYREAKGKFSTRKELIKVQKLGDKAFEQCAGFLRIPGGTEILDNTSVHPESYEAARKLLKMLGIDEFGINPGRMDGINQKIKTMGIEQVAGEIGVGVPTLKDIIQELLKPGRDPRDELPKPVLQTDLMDIKDIKPGMLLTGTVRNVADFGAFVDIGVHQDGLVHISELADRYVKNPMDVVAVGDIVKVKVLDVEPERKRISLSMKGLN
ncbi:MAG: Tex family protein [Bacillota bacterium]|nr:Tex family protein [Bacillota bacterium]